MCMRVGLSQTKNGLSSALALSMNLKASSRISSSTVSIRLDRACRRPRSSVCRSCPSAASPSVILVGGPTVDHVARADFVQQFLRVGGVRRVFHRVEVIEVAEELVEAMDRRQELIEIAKVVLAELARGIAHALSAVAMVTPRRAARWRPPDRPWSCRCGSAVRR